MTHNYHDDIPSSSRSSSRSCSRARTASHSRTHRSGSTTPTITAGARLPSRPSSPSRLRSLPSVGLSHIEALALSDNATGHGHGHADQDGADGETPQQLLEDSNGNEDWGRSREAVLPPPRSIATYKFAEESLIQSGISDYTFIPKEEGGLLGRGKFSSVQLAWKHGVKYAVKITPLYPHHNLIATRLLREPTILAQLPPHPNLVKVYESIRTPGHFYLVEEYLDGYTNLENFVSSQPESKLTTSQSLHIFHQLVSVVRTALHEPIQIAHRDIKPENILIHPITLRIILLDFGLSTHFSFKEPKLTTCCGSPAFHSPELVKSLKSSPGSLRYWGPEIDIWTIGITLLRCISGLKYPLGVQHNSLNHLNDKTIDAILSVKDKEIKRLLIGLLDMDGVKRMEFFKNLPAEIDQIPYKTLDLEEEHDYLIATTTSVNHQQQQSNGSNNPSNPTPPNVNGYNRHFKNTTFIETQPKHSLSLILASPSNSATQSGIQGLNQDSIGGIGSVNGGKPLSAYLRSRSHSRDKLTSFTNGLELNAVNERLSALNPSLLASNINHTSMNGSSSSNTATTEIATNEGSTTPLASSSINTPSSSPELILLNPQGEPAMRAISYVKYALRCAGIIYHCQSIPKEDDYDLSQDKPSLKAPRENLTYPILHCVRLVSLTELEKLNSSRNNNNNKSPATSALLNQFRPTLTRAATMGAVAAANAGRSVSQPPSRSNNNHNNNNNNNKNGKGSDEKVKCVEFWIQIVPVFLSELKTLVVGEKDTTEGNAVTSMTKERSSSQKRRPKSRSRLTSSHNVHKHHHHHPKYQVEDPRRCTKLRIRFSDESQLEILKKALSNTSNAENMDNYAMYATPPPRRGIPLPNGIGGKKSSNKSSSSNQTTSEEDTTEETSTEEQPMEKEERGRTKLSRSRSNEKTIINIDSRSPKIVNGRLLPSHTAPLIHDGSNGILYRSTNTKENEDGDETPQPLNQNPNHHQRQQQQQQQTSLNGVLEARLDSEEEAKLASQNISSSSSITTKRGFFDFVTAFNVRNKPTYQPTSIATAPSTPAAIPEELESDLKFEQQEEHPIKNKDFSNKHGNYHLNHNNNDKIGRNVQAVAFAPM